MGSNKLTCHYVRSQADARAHAGLVQRNLRDAVCVVLLERLGEQGDVAAVLYAGGELDTVEEGIGALQPGAIAEDDELLVL